MISINITPRLSKAPKLNKKIIHISFILQPSLFFRFVAIIKYFATKYDNAAREQVLQELYKKFFD